MSSTLAIVGRPNVGKSTLFNRLVGKSHALVHDQPGVTRDWREGKGNIGPLTFRVIDTAGLEQADKKSLAARMNKQTLAAVGEANAVLLVVDGRAGITEDDKFFARELRKTGKPVILAVNKAEGNKADATVNESYKLGFQDVIPISASHGEGMNNLYDALAPHFPQGDEEEEDPFEEEPETADEEEEEREELLHIAIIGRPNVGKSTLLNQLLGEDRVLTGPEAGITRDAIAVDYEYKGKKLKLIDTAGLRKKANITDQVEKMAASDTIRAIQFAQVVILVVDAEMALEKQDNTIAALVEKEGRGLIVAVNKWDKVENQQKVLDEIHYRLSIALPQIKGVPVVPISAIEGKGISKLFTAAFGLYDKWKTRVTTGALNRYLDAALARHSPPIVGNKRMKVRYMTQAKTRPPTFVLFVNEVADFPESYLRYLINGMREAFDLPGIPIRVLLKKPKNPYTNDKRR